MKTLAGTTWRAVEAMAVDDEGREVPSPIGQHPLGLVSFENDRMLVALTDARPSPGTPVRAMVAYTGKYRFDGAELVTDADVASRPDLITQQVRSIRFESPTRMVTSPKNDFLGGGQALGLSVVWERLIPTRLAVDTPSRGGKAVAHQRSAGSGVCQPFGGLV
jgi:hypothetical protein